MASTTDAAALSGVMQTYWDKLFLDRAVNELRHDYGATKKTMPRNSGKVVNFNRFSQLALATTAITESDFLPTAVNMTSTVVSATIAEYGNYAKVSQFFNLTSLDENLKEHVEVMGQNAGETIDALIAAELSANATAQIVGGKALTAVAATDVMTGAEIRKAVRTLKANKAPRFEDGMYRGIIQPFQSYDLFANSEWLSARQYTNPEDIKRGVIGDLHGVKFVETNAGSTEASTVTIYHTFICGKQGYGMISLAGQEGARVLVKNPNGNSTDNPLDTFSTVGWKAYFVAKVLNADRVICLKTGASA